MLKYLHTKLRLALTIRLGVVDKEDVEVVYITSVVDDPKIVLTVGKDNELVLTDVK